MKTLLLIVASLWLTIVVPVVVGLLQRDLEDGLPWLAERLVRRAARKLPEAVQERYLEEWLAELAEIPVRLAKLVVAIRIWLRARATARAVVGLSLRVELARRLARAMKWLWWVRAILVSELRRRRRPRGSGMPPVAPDLRIEPVFDWWTDEIVSFRAVD